MAERKFNYIENFENFKIHRNNILAESKESVLIKKDIGDNKCIEFWLNKKFVRINEYSLHASIGITPSWEYSLSNKAKITGLKLIDLYKEQ